MTQQGKNLRLRRTQKLLREALIELIEERGFAALTIGEITERAMVSRAAFYRNYQDKYDLVEQIFEEAMSALLNTMGEWEKEHPPKVWIHFFEHIEQYEKLYRVLLCRKDSTWFVRKMRVSLTELVKEHEGSYVAGRQRTTGWSALTFSGSFVPGLVATMLVEAITWWLEQGKPCTPEEIAKRCALLVHALFKEASTWK